jgi:ABC-type multidrug transport system ATPase subunit
MRHNPRQQGYVSIDGVPSDTSTFSFYAIPEPTFFRTFFAILKANLLIRRRTSSALVSIFVLPFLVLSLSDLDFGSKPELRDLKSPPHVLLPDPIANLSVVFRRLRKRSVFLASPDRPLVRTFCSPLPFNWMFTNNTKSLLKKLYNSSIGLSLHFINADAADFIERPRVLILTKDFPDASEESLLLALSASNFSRTITLSKREFSGRSTIFKFSSDSLVLMFVVFPIISVLSSESRIFVSQRESCVLQLLFLSGCRHLPFWVATVSTSLLCTFPGCFIISYYFTNEFLLVGSDFSLIFALFFCYCLAMSLFSLALLSNVNNGKSSRGSKILFTMLSIGFSLLNHFLTESHRIVCNLIALVFPQFSFSQGLASIFMFCRVSGPFSWGDISSGNEFNCVWSLEMLLLSAVFYGFIIFTIDLWQMTRFDLGRVASFFSSKTRHYFQSEREVITVSALSKSYDSRNVLADIEFKLEPGDIVGLIGSNGSGKSTLIGVLSGVIGADSGTVKLFERETAGLDELFECSGVCFQNNVLVPQLTVRQHLVLFGTVRGMNPSMLRSRIRFLEGQLLLADVAHNLARTLSGGQRRKLCVGLALLGEPPVAILDEPTAGVDFESRQLIWKALSERRDGFATLLTLHQLEEAEGVCTRLFVLRGGRFEFQGTATELRRQCGCGYVLRVVDDEYDKEGFGGFLREVVAELVEATPQTWVIPVGEDIGTLIGAIEEHKGRFGVNQFIFGVQSLEDALLKIAEAEDQPHRVKRGE